MKLVNPFFKNFNIFLNQKIHFSKNKFLKFSNYFKTLNVPVLWSLPNKFREFFLGRNYLLLNFIKNLNKNSLDPEGMKILANL